MGATPYEGIDSRNHEIRAGNAAHVLKSYNPQASYKKIEILNPLDGSVYPRDMASPFFKWLDRTTDVENWLVRIDFETSAASIRILCSRSQWIPDTELWETVKLNSLDAPAQISVLGYKNYPAPEIVSRGTVRIDTSRDPVGAPILFRRVPPSFSYAHSHPELMEWCLADISSVDDPPVIMSRQSYCASCHTASANGEILGMDMDYRGDKGSYFVTGVGKNILLKEEDFISWNDFPRDDGLQSSGLFSRLSPDGLHVVTTANDISFLAKISDPYCSQLFFPIQGHLAFYSKPDRSMHRLFTGQNRPEIIETDPSWSPDGGHILFSRTLRTRDLYAELGGDTIFSAVDADVENLNKQYPVHFNVYKVAFNDGNGGRAVPLEGASYNGRSNYFARYSPDGRWIVFTQSATGLVLQPDSRLYILPAGGGEARRMNCNRSRMNSWHTWSPNSRWLAFVSKENMPYTEMYLTHIDENGNDSIPVLASRFNKPGYAINVPEFVNIEAGGIQSISLQSGLQGNERVVDP
ncbi:MAG: hypothetical protein P8Y80_12790 [Acidobacteriota bacterium]